MEYSTSQPNPSLPTTDNQPDVAALARARIDAIHQVGPHYPQPVSPLQEEKPTKSRPAELTPTKISQSVPRPTKRTLPSRVRPILTATATFILLLFAFKLPVFIKQLSYHPAATPVVITPASQVEAVSPDPVLTIPKINVVAPVVYEPSIDEAKIEKALENGVVHYGTTPTPGQPGNAVFVGHSSNDWWQPGNFKFVFVLLDKLAIGDSFSINYQSRRYVYQVSDIKVVEPTDLSVLAPSSTPTVTLITCTPAGTNWKRLVVVAHQTSPAPGAAATTQATTPSSPTILPGSAPGILDQLGAVWDSLKHSVGNLFGKDKPDSTQPTTLPQAS